MAKYLIVTYNENLKTFNNSIYYEDINYFIDTCVEFGEVRYYNGEIVVNIIKL